MRTWRALDHCASAPPRTAVVGALTRRTWACHAGVRVRYALYAGGRHDWPAGSSTTPSAQSEIRSFFAAA